MLAKMADGQVHIPPNSAHGNQPQQEAEREAGEGAKGPAA